MCFYYYYLAGAKQSDVQDRVTFSANSQGTVAGDAGTNGINYLELTLNRDTFITQL